MSDCLLGPEPSEDKHHPTGRGPDGIYLDPDLVGPVCHDDHELAHDDLKTGKLENPPGDTFFEKLEVRLDRLARFFARLPEAQGGTGLGAFLGSCAAAFARWAQGLAARVRILDEHVPQWRALPGMA